MLMKSDLGSSLTSLSLSFGESLFYSTLKCIGEVETSYSKSDLHLSRGILYTISVRALYMLSSPLLHFYDYLMEKISTCAPNSESYWGFSTKLYKIVQNLLSTIVTYMSISLDDYFYMQ